MTGELNGIDMAECGMGLFGAQEKGVYSWQNSRKKNIVQQQQQPPTPSQRRKIVDKILYKRPQRIEMTLRNWKKNENAVQENKGDGKRAKFRAKER